MAYITAKNKTEAERKIRDAIRRWNATIDYSKKQRIGVGKAKKWKLTYIKPTRNKGQFFYKLENY